MLDKFNFTDKLKLKLKTFVSVTEYTAFYYEKSSNCICDEYLSIRIVLNTYILIMMI